MKTPRIEMFSDYLDGLQKLMGLPLYTAPKKLELFQNYYAGQGSKWIDIYDPKSGKDPVGFLVIGYPPNCHPNVDFYIEEAYIRPKYRRRRLMSAAVTEFVQSNPGVYCLFIVRGNEAVYTFWKNVFGEAGYSPCYLCDVGAADAYCTQYGFRQRRSK